MKKTLGLTALACASLTAVSAQAVDIQRLSAGKFPIASAVAVPAGYELYFLSGATGTPSDPKANPGDTKTQTVAALEHLKSTLKELGLTFADVVKMNVFLVADPKTGKMDFTGLMAGYTQYFGTKDQPNLPARSAVQVAGLASPTALVEIEVEAAKKIAK